METFQISDEDVYVDTVGERIEVESLPGITFFVHRGRQDPIRNGETSRPTHNWVVTEAVTGLRIGNEDSTRELVVSQVIERGERTGVESVMKSIGRVVHRRSGRRTPYARENELDTYVEMLDD